MKDRINTLIIAVSIIISAIILGLFIYNGLKFLGITINDVSNLPIRIINN